MAEIIINEEFCKGCKLCIEACPLHLIVEAERLNAAGYHPVEFRDDEGKCTGCALCAMMCPDSAIEVYREAEK